MRLLQPSPLQSPASSPFIRRHLTFPYSNARNLTPLIDRYLLFTSTDTSDLFSLSQPGPPMSAPYVPNSMRIGSSSFP